MRHGLLLLLLLLFGPGLVVVGAFATHSIATATPSRVSRKCDLVMEVRKCGDEERCVGPLVLTRAAHAAIPRHVALIPDGNSRWAAQHDRSTREGHASGAEALRTLVSRCAATPGLETLTVYALSTENLGRGVDEVDWLTRLIASLVAAHSSALLASGVRLRFLGDLGLLPDRIRKQLERAAEREPEEQRLLLCVAIGYGGRREIASVARVLAERVQRGELCADEIDEELFSRTLSVSSTLSDPDLLVRTGGEQRLSNFLLYQLAYTELVTFDTLWPDFTPELFAEALDRYSQRGRNFGLRRATLLEPEMSKPVAEGRAPASPAVAGATTPSHDQGATHSGSYTQSS
jgi:undecaprenyl diphosphate synthase